MILLYLKENTVCKFFIFGTASIVIGLLIPDLYKKVIPIIGMSVLAWMAKKEMNDAVREAENTDNVYIAKQKEKSIVFYNNFLAFYGMAYPVFMRLFSNNANEESCSSMVDLMANMICLLVFTLVMLWIRLNYERIWKRIVDLEIKKDKEKETREQTWEHKFEQRELQLGCPCSVSRESCSCPQRRWPPSRP